MKNTLDYWMNVITSDEIWYEQLQMRHPGKDVKKAVQKCFLNISAERSNLDSYPEGEFKKYVNNTLNWQKEEPKDIRPAVSEYEPVDLSQAVTGEERMRWLEKWKETISQTPVKRVPKLTYREIMEEGGWLPKKEDKIYPHGTRDDLVALELHRQYIRENYDPRTGKPLDTWIPEQEWIESLNRL